MPPCPHPMRYYLSLCKSWNSIRPKMISVGVVFHVQRKVQVVKIHLSLSRASRWVITVVKNSCMYRINRCALTILHANVNMKTKIPRFIWYKSLGDVFFPLVPDPRLYGSRKQATCPINSRLKKNPRIGIKKQEGLRRSDRRSAGTCASGTMRGGRLIRQWTKFNVFVRNARWIRRFIFRKRNIRKSWCFVSCESWWNHVENKWEKESRYLEYNCIPFDASSRAVSSQTILV